ncbi:MAG: HlyD family type I secretion periplasmic adaptor subunit [Pseudomonadota bacterium]
MKNWLDIFINAWRDRASLGDASKQHTLAEFLPAALEIQETPPHPLARWLGISLISLFAIAVIWACFGRVDIVASAEGKIIPSGRVKIVQPLAKGFVKAIYVKEGQYVKQGEVLVELDRTSTAADQSRMEKELHTGILDLAGAQTLHKLLTAQKTSISSAAQIKLMLANDIKIPESENTMRQQMVWQQWQQYQAQLGGLHSSQQKAEAEKAFSLETIKKLQQTLPMVTKRAQGMESLFKKKMAAEIQYMEVEQARIENVQNLAAEQQRQNQLEAAIHEAKQQINALKADTLNKILSVITENTDKVAALREELIKATDVNAKQMLYAPVNGYVQELAISTIGGIVTEAQKLMSIVPEEESLEVEVLLGNNDIGFVQKDMIAEIKIHTFPFTKYGLIDATVTNISDDAIIHEKLGLVYAMHLKMHKNSINVESKVVKLIPGMAVTAEVKTDKRRVIEFFLAPLLKYKQESIRER